MVEATLEIALGVIIGMIFGAAIGTTIWSSVQLVRQAATAWRERNRKANLKRSLRVINNPNYKR